MPLINRGFTVLIELLNTNYSILHPDVIEVSNRAVDVSSWARLTCYPRSSFYPLIFSAPISKSRFTKFEFPLGATCKSCRQAGLCLYTSSAISIRAKPTFKRLRYSLGGIRPRQTNHQILSPSKRGIKDQKYIRVVSHWCSEELPPITEQI